MASREAIGDRVGDVDPRRLWQRSPHYFRKTHTMNDWPSGQREIEGQR